MLDIMLNLKYMNIKLIWEPIILLKETIYISIVKKLNVDKIKEALNYFVGTHDFTTFTCAEDKRDDKIRTILAVDIKVEEDILIISFEGTGFLKYQIRNMIGLLIKIGEDKLNAEEIPYLFEKKDRRKIGLTAPACGLTLVKVNY